MILQEACPTLLDLGNILTLQARRLDAIFATCAPQNRRGSRSPAGHGAEEGVFINPNEGIFSFGLQRALLVQPLKNLGASFIVRHARGQGRIYPTWAARRRDGDTISQAHI